MYLRSGLPPGGRPDLRINQYAKYATYTEYAKYGFFVLLLASASPVGALIQRWTMDMLGRGAAVTCTLVSFGNA